MTNERSVVAGQIYLSQCYEYRIRYDADDRGDPTVERWELTTNAEDAAEGDARLELCIVEVVDTQNAGPLVVYRRRWLGPDGEQFSRQRRCIHGLSSVKRLIRNHKMEAQS